MQRGGHCNVFVYVALYWQCSYMWYTKKPVIVNGCKLHPSFCYKRRFEPALFISGRHCVHMVILWAQYPQTFTSEPNKYYIYKQNANQQNNKGLVGCNQEYLWKLCSFSLRFEIAQRKISLTAWHSPFNKSRKLADRQP